jgi:hypothetical protein
LAKKDILVTGTPGGDSCIMQESPPGVPVTKIMMKHQFHHLEVNTMGYSHGINIRTPCAQHMIAHRQKVPRRPGA